MFSAAELVRLDGSLERLLPWCAAAGVALTGGVAVEYHLAQAGRTPLRDTIGDVDLIAERLDRIAPGVARDFLVSHFHTMRPGVPKALLQLVDPRTKLRIDLFPDLHGAASAAATATIGVTTLPIVSAARLLEHKLQTLASASSDDPGEPKHWRDAIELAAICSVALPPPPRALRPAVYEQDPDRGCVRCERSRSADFPLAPKRTILALLGYV